MVDDKDVLQFAMIGYETKTMKVGKRKLINVSLVVANQVLEEFVVTDKAGMLAKVSQPAVQNSVMIRGGIIAPRQSNTESYQDIEENGFKSPVKDPLSTFAADVDAASYSNVRRMINAGQLPVKDAVRVEELINYFQYNLKAPTNGDPVNMLTELATAPWNKEHQLLRIALKAKDIPSAKLPASNFVFLIDVSGSMYGPNRLPLVKSSLKMLVDQLRDRDQVAIVT